MKNKTKRELIIVVILLFVLLGLIIAEKPWQRFRSPERTYETSSGVDISRQKVLISDIPIGTYDDVFGDLETDMYKRQRESLSRTWGRDPFQYNGVLGISEDSQEVGFELTGISFRGDKAYAILDDYIVHVGMKVEEYVVKEIGRNHVILERGQKSYILRMKPDDGL
ncbi:hypothetical protein IID04_07715 [PVC group bacterium]|nr:hypothetical protein [PVC group bacterium]